MNRPKQRELAMPRTGVFTTTDPALQRSVQQLERNAIETVKRVSNERLGTLKPTSVIFADADVQLGEFVLVDPSAGPIALRLPRATAAAAGRWLVVKNVSSSANGVTVQAIGGDEVDGFAGGTVLACAGGLDAARVYCDGQGFWVW